MNVSVTTRPDLLSATARQRQLAVAAAVLIVLLMAATTRHLLAPGHAGAALLGNPWLLLHLLSVGPALPLGAVVMLCRKGGRTHRLLGRGWALLMFLAAVSGMGLGKGWSPIHLLSLLTLATVPISVWAAIRGDIRAHRRGMTLLFASLVVAGFFTLLPVRLLGGWLFGSG